MQDQASGNGAGGNGTSSYAELPYMVRCSSDFDSFIFPDSYFLFRCFSLSAGPGERERRWRQRDYADSLTW
ncbi:unnamed protein product [Closterium sp. Yama58-4]|nr:unnamed protein product [Closterium sp. Yama58-4]